MSRMMHGSKMLLVAVLMISIGAPWAFLQSVAWIGMTVAYSVREGSVVEGVSQTFDGSHPCVLCQTVAEGTRSATGAGESNLKPVTEKLILARLFSEALLTPPSGARCEFALAPPRCASLDAGKPPVPPPRAQV